MIYLISHGPRINISDKSGYKPFYVGLRDNSQELNDLIGENMNNLFPTFAELTCHYWDWKNQNSEIVGFYHYRRFFDLSANSIQNPLYQFDLADGVRLNKLLGDDSYNYANEILSVFDFIIPAGFGLDESIRDHFNRFHPSLPWQIFLDLARQRFGSSVRFFDFSRILRVGNMYVTRRSLHEEISGEIFSILLAMYDEIGVLESKEPKRFNDERYIAYFSERLLSFLFATSGYKNFEASVAVGQKLQGRR